MVSDSELIARLREFLRGSDLNTTTTGTVRRRLEEDFGVDLTDKKAFIREQVDLFLQSEHEVAEEDGEAEEDDRTATAETQETDRSGSKNEDDDDEEEEVEETSNGKGKRRSVNFIFTFTFCLILHFQLELLFFFFFFLDKFVFFPVNMILFYCKFMCVWHDY
jgi:hypothetical protein